MICSTLSCRLLSVVFVVLTCIVTTQAQDTTVPSSEDSTDKVVRIIRFSGNNNVKDKTLEGLIRTHTNREFLGIPRFTPWYFVWQLTKNVGEPPALLNLQTLQTDVQRIERYYETIGYLQAEVQTNIVEFKPNRVEVSFLIEEGQRSYINTIAYSGMPEFSDPEVLSRFYARSDLTEEQLNDSTFVVDHPYSENALAMERTRIIRFLRSNGYASVQRDSILAQVKQQSNNPQQLDVLFTVDPGRIYTFGDVYISLYGPDGDGTFEDRDTLQGRPATVGDNAIYLRKSESAQTRFSLLTDQILFKPGSVFNNTLYIRSINEFQNLGMMTIRQFGLSKDGSLPDYSQDEIPVMFSLQTLPRHSVNFNLFGMKRYGFGSGAGITYTNNNLFGKAENLQLGLNGSFEYVSSETLRDISTDTTGNQNYSSSFFQSFETRAEYSLPRLIFPFTVLDDNTFFTNARTRYLLSFSRSDQLLFDINLDVRFNLRYEANHNQRFSSFLDLIELDLLDTDPSSQFRESLQREFGEDSFEYQRILEDFRPQISSILRYTFRSQRTDLIKRDFGYFSEYSIATGGNIPYLSDRFIVTPDTVEGNLPPIVGFSSNSLSYSRFVKFSADYRRYIPISSDAVFAYRGFLGLAYPYGKNKTIPLNQRFYAGGSNDIRGWDIYSLGPGSIPLEDVTINGGEIKLLAQTEVRQTLLNQVLSADWILAWFTDAGNVWYGPNNDLLASASILRGDPPLREEQSRENLELGRFKLGEFYRQIAVGSGLGIRMDWEYVVARFDFTYRIHDLQRGWFNNNRLYFSFGIGHSF